MKKIFIAMLLILGLGIYNTFCQSNEEDAIIGKWYTEENKSIIEIFKVKDRYFGKIVWIEEPNDEDGNPKLDKENPSPEYRQRPILGMNFMFNFQYDGGDVWNNGQVYDPESGNTYSGKLTLEEKNTINARGFIGFSIIGRTTTWTRKLD